MGLLSFDDLDGRQVSFILVISFKATGPHCYDYPCLSGLSLLFPFSRASTGRKEKVLDRGLHVKQAHYCIHSWVASKKIRK